MPPLYPSDLGGTIMKLQLGVVTIAFALCATSASAGRIFGDVKVAAKPAAEGMLITVQAVTAPAVDKKETPPPAPIDSVMTDKVGSYKVVVKNEGKCTLTVYMGKKTATLEIFSYKEPTRYDLIVEEKDGKLSVRRK
jgi:hypothetical protein